MKKILASLLLVIMVSAICVGFAACNKYSSKTYTMTSFAIYNPDGSEVNISQYKQFMNITYYDEIEIEHQYNKQLSDIDSVKSFVLMRDKLQFAFDTNNNVVFTYDTISNNVLKQRMVYEYTGEYTVEKGKLDIKFKNYKLDDNGKKIQNSANGYVTEMTDVIPSFYYGEGKGNMNLRMINDNSFTITLYAGLSTSSKRIEMTFTKD